MASKKDFFPKSTSARALLREKQELILAELMDTIQKAKDAGNYEAALKSLHWLLEHMPKDEDGQRMIDASVDKDKPQIEQKQAPQAIQIGIQVGGVGRKALPAVQTETVDADE